MTYTNEQIRAMADGCKQCGDSRVGEMLEAWLAERQAARDGVTDEFRPIRPKVPGYWLVRRFCLDDGEENRTACVEVRQYDDGTGEHLIVNLHETNTEDDPGEWYRVEDLCDDFQWLQLAAVPVRAALQSIAQPVRVLDLSNLTDDQLREFVAIGLRHAEISNFEIDDLRPAFKRLNAILSSSPQPQQAVPEIDKK